MPCSGGGMYDSGMGAGLVARGLGQSSRGPCGLRGLRRMPCCRPTAIASRSSRSRHQAPASEPVTLLRQAPPVSMSREVAGLKRVPEPRPALGSATARQPPVAARAEGRSECVPTCQSPRVAKPPGEASRGRVLRPGSTTICVQRGRRWLQKEEAAGERRESAHLRRFSRLGQKLYGWRARVAGATGIAPALQSPLHGISSRRSENPATLAWRDIRIVPQGTSVAIPPYYGADGARERRIR